LQLGSHIPQGDVHYAALVEEGKGGSFDEDFGFHAAKLGHLD